MSGAEEPWSVPVAVGDIPEAGLKIELDADEITRLAIARAAGVDALLRLRAAFDVRSQGRDKVHLVGEVSATVKQTCGVTLEPVLNEIVEEIELVFAPDEATAAGARGGGSEQNSGAETPEPLVGGMVDLGAIATEFLVLGIDPYPRKPGAVFNPPQDPDEEGGPFAVLARLKRNGRDPSA
jgi:hypothetical protein